MRRYLLAATTAAAVAFTATPASATICIGVAFNGGAITNVGCDGGTGTVNYNATNNGYVFNVNGSGSPLLAMPQLLTQSINIRGQDSVAAIIDVYLTQSNLTAFNSGLLSSFTSNTMTGVSAAEITSYWSAANANFAGTVLQTNVFNSPGVFSGVNLLNAANPWSETVRYRLTFTGAAGSNFNGTANLAAIPEPATWAMMLLGFGGIGFAMRRRRQPALAQIA